MLLHNMAHYGSLVTLIYRAP